MPPLQKCHRSNLGKPPISEIKRRTNLKNPITNQSKTLDWENKFWEKKIQKSKQLFHILNQKSNLRETKKKEKETNKKETLVSEIKFKRQKKKPKF